MPVFVDTNVLVYARDASEGAKQEHAEAWLARLWGSREGRLSYQVLQEYYVTVTRKLQPGLPPADARADVRDLLAWDPTGIDGEVVEAAWRLESRWGLSFWDAAIVASARSAGCQQLLSEDLADEQTMSGVTVFNPFTHEPDSIGSLGLRR